jgi:hypothetical protein
LCFRGPTASCKVLDAFPVARIDATFVNLETSPFYAVAAYLGIGAIYLGLVTDYVGDPTGWNHGLWDRPNTTDASIMKLIRQLVQTVGEKGPVAH